jgi:hypothetical protein
VERLLFKGLNTSEAQKRATGDSFHTWCAVVHAAASKCSNPHTCLLPACKRRQVGINTIRNNASSA